MENKNTQDKKPAPVTFYVYRKDGSKHPEIKTYFLLKHDVSIFDVKEEYLTLEDKSKWKLVLEPEVEAALKSKSSVFCMVSYQARLHGNFAVCRVYDASRARKPKGEEK